MKKTLKDHPWLLSIPIIAFATVFQYIYDLGDQGKLDSAFIREKIYPVALSINGTMTNVKFRLRGPEPVKNRIVVVNVDDGSVNRLGRWPWKRKIYAYVFHSMFKLGAKVIGADVTFSEAEESVPSDLQDLIKKDAPAIANQLPEWDGDAAFADVVRAYQHKLVLGQAANAAIRPRYANQDEIDAMFSKDYGGQVPEAIGKFALSDAVTIPRNVLERSPLSYLISVISNVPVLRDSGLHAGFFNIDPDPDGYVRRYPLVMLNSDRAYTTLGMKVAEIVKNDQLRVKFTEDGRVERMWFSKTPEKPIPVTSLGYLDLNFRGPAESFTYIPVSDVIDAAEDPNETKIHALMKDAVVFFGVSAIGLYDMRAFPFDFNTPGVEGHATALDNLLSEDYMRSAAAIQLHWLPIALLIALGLVFAALFSRFEAVPSLSIFLGFAVIFGAVDVKLLFQNYINLPTAFLFLEILSIFVVILAFRYYLEEKAKKDIRDAFSHYLAPAVVDMVLKDPSKLAVGGERKDLTILFSDLRGFTTISEGLDPKTLSQFLNEYLSEMTDIVFEHEGTLDKYIGDAIMAFWGAPLHQEDHALRATQAAMKMVKRLHEIAPDFKTRYGVDIGMGIGINSGVVSVGNMGSKKIFEYTVIGDHVNLASRLEGLNRLYGTEILTSRNTIDAIPEAQRKHLSYRIIDSVKVKGKKQASDLIQITHQKLHDSLIETYYLAREEFKKRNWEEARRLFQKCIELHQQHHGSSDPVAEIFLERLEAFRMNPPDEQWDGTIEMRTK